MAGIESFEKYSGLGNAKGLVHEFLVALKKAGVEVRELGGVSSSSNIRILKRRDLRVAVIPKASSPTAQGGWWGVMENHVKHLKELRGKWGIVFLRQTQEGNDLDVGFSVTGDDFEKILEGSQTPSENGQYEFHGCYLEEKPYAQKFHTFTELKSLRLLSEIID